MTGYAHLHPHGLVGEGRPHDAAGQPLRCGPGEIVWGYGRCKCGATSPMLRTRAERRRWHAEHKRQVSS